MATPTLEKASLDLAYKLQDPVASGTTDGARVTAAGRLGYIIRAYRRLLRIVTVLYPSLIQRLFQRYYTIVNTNTNTDGTIDFIGTAEIYNLYCKRPTDEEYSKATWISPDKFLDVKMGYNALYVPNINTSTYYWTILDNEINVLPTIQYSLSYLARTDVARKVEDSGYGGATDLDIPREFLDVLLSMAASEAYMDIGQADMANIFTSDVNSQLSLLTANKQEKQAEDSEDENP